MKKGFINNEELVELFGTNKNKNSYSVTKKVNSSMKNTLLNRAKLYCDIEDLGNGKYNILKVFNKKVNINVYNILNNDIYKNLAPIIISNLIKSEIHNKNSLKLGLTSYYGLFNLIHRDNYNNIRHNSSAYSKELDLEVSSINKYFTISNEKLKYYLETCLEMLKKACIIQYFKIPFVKIRNPKIENTHKKVKIIIDDEYRRASEEEIRYVEDCVTLICSKYDIIRDNFVRIYFDPRLAKAKDEYNELLIKKNIVLYYKGYEIYYTDIKKSEEFMLSFKKFNNEYAIKNFVELISNSIKESINNRYYDIEDDVIIFLNENVLDYTKDTFKLHTNIKENSNSDYRNYVNEITYIE